MVGIQVLDEKHRDRVDRILLEEWNCPPSVSKGKLIDTTVLPGFLFIVDEEIKGVVTYNIEGSECEIVTLNSFEENRGIGKRLIDAVLGAAEENGCKRLFLITTNDNTRAIHYYQRQGFELAGVYLNAMDAARKIKPSVPLIGMNDIPIKHEFEFEKII